MSIQGSRFVVMLVTGVAVMDLAGAQQPSPPKDIATCAAIEAQAERLTCYDSFAGRGAKQPAAPSAASAPPGPGAASAPTSAGHVAPKAAGTSAAHDGATAPPAASGAPPADSKEAFGLYAMEHPTTPQSSINSITGKVSGVTYDRYGKETISLEEGPVWQLAGSDALLAKGDSVTIKRAAFGSYVMTTPSGREHRVKRLR